MLECGGYVPDPSDEFGGRESPKDWREYILGTGDNKKSCDKGGHKERSRNNDEGQHDRHWKKEDSKKER